ncbi:MAG: hypothetical protein OXH79_19220 [Boseongicola sp.]|nr:hypothetical protein [Boseongicola sp.]
MGVRDRATLSTGDMVPAVRIDRRWLKRPQRAVSRAKKGLASRRKTVGALWRAWERTRIRERDSAERERIREAMEREIVSLREGNFARYNAAPGHPNLPAGRRSGANGNRLVSDLDVAAMSIPSARTVEVADVGNGAPLVHAPRDLGSAPKSAGRVGARDAGS